MKYKLLFLLFYSNYSNAFVAGPSAVQSGDNYLSLGVQLERGLVEPNENKASCQNAQIDLQKLKYVRGFNSFFGLSQSSFFVEYGNFSSSKEEVGSNFFYDKDQGSYLTFGLSQDLVRELDKQFGFYIQISPLRSYNKNKFSNPRIDLFALGLTSAFDISENFFQKSLIHFGSGEGSSQNSYLAIDTGYGYRLNQVFDRQLTVLGSLFLEADTSERKDSSYDAVFSAVNTQDRVRAFKYGTVLGIDMALTQEVNLSANYLQKLGGYDARSTQIYTLNLGFKF